MLETLLKPALRTALTSQNVANQPRSDRVATERPGSCALQAVIGWKVKGGVSGVLGRGRVAVWEMRR
ncbi:hypothetical protein AB5J62_18785 [Amycolatopsis sp. cg5]|uniref:hypothetical protein n=1 Tax=Amycolatopsis sp. cg5 TaxID=3238802 RepID=UPI0035244D8D